MIYEVNNIAVENESIVRKVEVKLYSAYLRETNNEYYRIDRIV